MTLAVAETPGMVIDRYKLLEKLGGVGFGAVCAAEQRVPVKTRVALGVSFEFARASFHSLPPQAPPPY